MNKAPSFQFYAADFLGGTSNFTDAEVGLYIRLLIAQFNLAGGGLPNDDRELLYYGKSDKPTRLDRVKAKFKVGEDGLLRNERLENERLKRQAYIANMAENGKLGGRPKKPKDKPLVLKTIPEQNPNPNQVIPEHKAEETSSVFSLQSSLLKPLPVQKAYVALQQARSHRTCWLLISALASHCAASENEIIDRLTGYLFDEEEAGQVKRAD